MNKKVSSSANVGMIICFCILFFSFLINFYDENSDAPSVEIIVTTFLLLAFIIFCRRRIPFNVPDTHVECVDGDTIYDQYCEKKIGWLQKLSFIICSMDSSPFISFFAKSSIGMMRRGSDYKFFCKDEDVTQKDKVLDGCLVLGLTPIFCFIGSMLGLLDYRSVITLCLIVLLLKFRENIVYCCFSFNIDRAYDYNINIVYPLNSAKSNLAKSYGFADPISKTIVITEDAISLGDAVKDFVIAHERGQVNNRKIVFLRYLTSILVVPYLILLPCLLVNWFNMWVALVPIISFLIYVFTLEYKIREKVEFMADEYAIKAIGKERCMEALEIMSDDEERTKTFSDLLFKEIPMSRRIQFINDYDQEKN